MGRRNPVARDLRTPKYRQRRVPVKKRVDKQRKLRATHHILREEEKE